MPVARSTYWKEPTTSWFRVSKTVTLQGAQAGIDARTRTAVPESVMDNGDGDFQILADSVTIDGFTIQGAVNDPSAPPFTGLGAGIWSNPGFSGTHGGQVIANNIIRITSPASSWPTMAPFRPSFGRT